MAKFTAEEIEKKRNEYYDQPHPFWAIMYVFRALIHVVKRLDKLEKR